LGIENLNLLILVIKNWLNNVCVGYDGAHYLMDMIDFLTLIVENNKLIKE
jgi:hypothetical protein